MLKRTGICIFLAFFLAQGYPAYPQYSHTYEYVSELAHNALEQNFVEDALYYFKILHTLNPRAQEPLIYIEKITKMQVRPQGVYSYQPLGREQDFLDSQTTFPDSREASTSLYDQEKSVEEKILRLPRVTVSGTGDREEKKISPLTASPRKPAPVEERKIARPEAVSAYAPSEAAAPPSIQAEKLKARTLYLTDELFSTQPRTEIQLPVDGSLKVEGRSIKRYLIIDPDVLDIERLDDKQVLIVSKAIGTTLIHIWDETRRWTFTVKILPARILPRVEEERRDIYYADPFKVFYNAEWRNYSKGRRIDSLDRETLSFDQNIGFYGDTPFGTLDGSMRYAKYEDNYELTNYTLGLTDGQWGSLKDFNARIFDIDKGFSTLTYPGGLLRGAYWEADAFGKLINYSLIWGEEREGSYGYYTPGILTGRESNIDGFQIRLFPYEQTNYAFNYTHGYGDGRDDYLSDNVYSIQINHSQSPYTISSEVAYNERAYAGYVNTDYRGETAHLYANLRNIEKDFTTINGRPGDLGELGVILGLDMPLDENNYLTSSLDIFRDRYFYNESKRHDPNYNFQAALSSLLGEASNLYSTFYYSNEPGLSFPRRYLSLRSTYSRNFSILGEHTLNTFLGLGYQRSRNPLSPFSDYDVSLATAGARYYLTRALSCYANLTYNWLDEKFIDERYNPVVYETGLDYHKKLTSKLTGDFRIYYRDEEETEATHSFLAGEDSLEGSLRLSYYPSPDIELYIDGRVRNVWAEQEDTEKYVESEIRLGINSTWDTFFSFSPKGTVSGYVFKDANGNGILDNGELPLKDIAVSVGDIHLNTDDQGYYAARIRAKRAKVEVKQESLPQGYVLTTANPKTVEIVQDGETYADFGMNTSSSIYGIVFYDQNGNGIFDSADKGIGDVRITLDGRTVTTSPDGRYFFRSISAGEYSLSVDINSIPLEYLPTIRLQKQIVLREGMNYAFVVPLTGK